MNSEKVKEIKDLFENCGFTLKHCGNCVLWKDEDCIETIKSKVLTYINELESENKELKKYKTDWLNSDKIHLQAELEDTEFELASSNRILGEVNKENKTLKDRIAKLEKENKDYYDRLDNAQTYIDNHEEIWKVNTKIQLQQFSERLKEKMSVREYMGVKYKQGVFSENDIDETIKEFDL